MSEQDKNQGENKVTEQPVASSPSNTDDSAVQAEEAKQLEAQKIKLEEEIRGLEGTKASLLDDVVRTRKEKKDVVEDQPPQVDVEAIKKEVEESILGKVSEQIVGLKDELVKAKDSEIASKKALVESINARMASATGSRSPASNAQPNVDEVELTGDEKKIAQELGLKNPRYLKDVEVL